MVTLREITVFGNADEADRYLETIRSAVIRSCDWINAKFPRDGRARAIHALLGQAAPFLVLPLPTQSHGLPVLALSCRTLFELELRTAHVIRDEANMKHWLGEGITDGIEVIQALLTVRNNIPPRDPAALHAEIDRLRTLGKKYQLTENAQLLSVHQLAKGVDRKEDYDTFFKLLSKLIHPSAYLVNGMAGANDRPIRELLVRNLQFFAINMLEEVRATFDIPESVVFPPEGGGAVH